MKRIFLFLLLGTSGFLLANTTNINFVDTIKSEKKIILPDTLKKGQYYAEIRVRWQNDTIVIRKYSEPTKVDTSFFRKLHNNQSYIPDSIEINNNNAYFATAAQNCHSYALECYFAHNNTPENKIFDKTSSILSDSYPKVLKASFRIIQVFHVSKSKKLKPEQEISNNSLLVFSNKYGTITHSVFYYNGIFHTKNGILKADAKQELADILKNYWDTTEIKVYKHL